MPKLIHFDFERDKSAVAKEGGITLTSGRALGTGWTRNSSGLWVPVAANVLRFIHDAAGVSQGLLSEPGRESVSLQNRDWNNAVWSGGANMTAAKDAVGISGVINSASTLTAGANNAQISQPITAGSLERTLSVWMRRKTGSGAVLLTDDGFSTSTDVTADINALTYTQVGDLTTTQANPDVGVELAANGDEVEVDFCQVEDGPYFTSPIEVVASPVTRNFDNVSGTIPVPFLLTAGSSYLRSTIAYSHNQVSAQMEAAGGTTNRLYFHSSGTYPRFAVASSAGSNLSILANFPNWHTQFKEIATAFSANDAVIYTDGSAGTVGASYDVPTVPVNGIRFGHRPGPSQVGSIIVSEFIHWDERFANAVVLGMSNGQIPGAGSDVMGPLRRRRGR